MTIEQISEQYRVPVKRDECGDPIIAGKNGHVYVDEEKPFICFTDDGRKRPLSVRQKTAAIKKLGDGLVRIKQNAECEFTGELRPDALSIALFRVLGVKRFMVTKGVSRPVPEAFVKRNRDAAERKLRGKKGDE